MNNEVDDVLKDILCEPVCSEHGVPFSECEQKHRIAHCIDIAIMIFSVLMVILVWCCFMCVVP